MKISLGKYAGFCGGVINSVNKTYELVNELGNIYCFGELVHNKQVVDELSNNGVVFVDDLNDVPIGDRVIIRAHGVSVDMYKLAKKRNLTIYDLTCPKVLKVHELAESLVQEGYFIILIAQKRHPEAVGTISFCGKNSMIIEDENDIPEFVEVYEKSNLDKIAIISQTTYSVSKFDDICSLISDKFDNVFVHNTICMATSQRQMETVELSKKVDAMIIIGGINSSNTQKLYGVSKENNNNTFIIQTVDDLKKESFDGYEHVGVMAGASTPKKSIDEVIEYLESFNLDN